MTTIFNAERGYFHVYLREVFRQSRQGGTLERSEREK